jgi:transglutaminase-like putative cysteine protease
VPHSRTRTRSFLRPIAAPESARALFRPPFRNYQIDLAYDEMLRPREREAEDGQQDRSLEGASHAWVEALVPRLGWTAFDPTNNLIGGDRHIRAAIGRDYADVPPTRGVYKGEARSELSVAVTVSPSDAPPPEQSAPSSVIQSRPVFARASSRTEQEQQQQQ